MFHELLAYFAGSLMLFALSAKGLFIAVTILAILSAAGVWWACGAFGRLWYVKFQRRPLHWILTILASTGTFFFVYLIAASAYGPQISMVSALVWRAELTYDTFWRNEVLEKTYNSIKEAGFEDEANFHPLGEGTIPVNHDESKRIVSKIEAAEAHRHFRENRPLLSRVFWNDPGDGAEKVYQHMIAHFGGDVGESAGESSDAVLVDIAEAVPNWDVFLADLDRSATSNSLLGVLLEGCGITSGLEVRMTQFDRRLKDIEAQEAEGRGSLSTTSMHYAILANEILMEAIDKAERVRTVLIFSLIGLFLLFLLVPFGVIGIAARREADLSRNQPVQY